MIRASSSCRLVTPASTTRNCGKPDRCRVKSSARISPAFRRSLRLTKGRTATEYVWPGSTAIAAVRRLRAEPGGGLRDRRGLPRFEMGEERRRQAVQRPGQQHLAVVDQAQGQEPRCVVSRQAGVVGPDDDGRGRDRHEPDRERDLGRGEFAEELERREHDAVDALFPLQQLGGGGVDARRVPDAMACHERFEGIVAEHGHACRHEPLDHEPPDVADRRAAAAQVLDRKHGHCRHPPAGGRGSHARGGQQDEQGCAGEEPGTRPGGGRDAQPGRHGLSTVPSEAGRAACRRAHPRPPPSPC